MEGMLRVSIGRTDTIGLFVLLDLFSLFRYVCVAVCVRGWVAGKRIMEDNGRFSSTAIDVTEDDCRNDG